MGNEFLLPLRSKNVCRGLGDDGLLKQTVGDGGLHHVDVNGHKGSWMIWNLAGWGSRGVGEAKRFGTVQ